MRHAAALPIEPAPIGSINTTPLIDVLLVLLIMFILCVPVATHKVSVDLPQPARDAAPPPVTHRLAVDRAGVARLDGSAAALDMRLRAVAGEAGASLRFEADGRARWAGVDAVLARVKRAGVERMGFAALPADW